MKKSLLPLFFALLFCSCSNDDNFYDDVPQSIISFITDYWPNPEIAYYNHPTENEYNVTIKNGPSLSFNGDFSWTKVDGQGLPLPEQFLFDNLPSVLYDYLEGGEYLNQVFEVQRNARTYNLVLLNFDIVYDIASQQITEQHLEPE